MGCALSLLLTVAAVARGATPSASAVPEWALAGEEAEEAGTASPLTQEEATRTPRLFLPIEGSAMRFRPSLESAGTYRIRWRIGTAGLEPCCEVTIKGHTYSESDSLIYRWSPYLGEGDEVAVKVIHPNSSAVFQVEIVDAFPKTGDRAAGATLLKYLHEPVIPSSASLTNREVRVGSQLSDGHVAWCGGVLIDAYRVLTAAHCARNADGLFVLGPDGSLSDHVTINQRDPYGDTAILLTEDPFPAPSDVLKVGSPIDSSLVNATVHPSGAGRSTLAGRVEGCYVTSQNTPGVLLTETPPLTACSSGTAAIQIRLDGSQRVPPGASGSGIWSMKNGSRRLLGVVSGHPKGDTSQLLMARVPDFLATTGLADLGKKIFFDPSLSASGKQSCASCHDPHTAFAPDNVLAVQLGGPQGNVPGFRAVPSLMYLTLSAPPPPPTTGAKTDDEEDGVPGFNWDWTAPSLVEQAATPLLAAHEMANASPATVVKRLASTAYVDDFRRLFGSEVLSNEELAFFSARVALAAYQGRPEFHPFDSKYDRVLRGQAKLSSQERRGLAAFNDPARGNCASCHASARAANGEMPLFGDGGLDALGVARNENIPANQDPQYFDLGACGSTKGDPDANAGRCGQFRTPTLRNVATRHVFFHNGMITSLRDAVAFYATRDLDPSQWYPTIAGTVAKFNDLPTRFTDQVKTNEAPYKHGKGRALTEKDVDDIVAFLQTLTDTGHGTTESFVASQRAVYK